MAGVGRGIIFRPDKGLRVVGRPMAGLGAKGLTTVPNKRVEDAGIPWAKKEDVIDGLHESKKIDAICSANVGRGTIFGLDKGLKVAGGPIAKLGAKSLTTALDKRVEGTGILWAKRGDVIDGLDKSKKTNVICSTGVGGGTIFGLDKS